MAINKVIYDGNTLIDLTDDTVDASTLLVGYTAHDRSGAIINGAFDPSIYVLKAGDTMTGALTLSGAPTSNLHAATKKYVDDAVGAITDTKVTQTVTTTDAGYNVLFSNSTRSSTSTLTEGARKASTLYYNPCSGLRVDRYNDTTGVKGTYLVCGNEIPNGTVGSTKGILRLFDNTEYYGQIQSNTSAPLTNNRTYYLPDESGTLVTRYYLASIGDATTPVYFNSAGKPTVCTSIPTTFISGNFVTSVALSGNNGISISGSPITSSGTITVGLNLSTAINGLTVGSVASNRNDYIVAQAANGGTTTTTYHRRPLSGIFGALNSSDITNALGYTPPQSDTNDAVTQSSSSESANYRILLSNTNSDSTETAGVKKSISLLFNPSTGNLTMARKHTATATANTLLTIGNSTANGTAGASHGVLRIYGKGQYYVQFVDENNALTASRNYNFPNKEGTLAILEDDMLDVGNRGIQITDADVGRSVSIRTKAGGIAYFTYFANGNHGVYSSGYESDIADSSTYTASNKWIIRRNSGGNVFVDEWASLGTANTPVYLSSSGRPVAGNDIRNVTQTETTTNANYEILLSATASDGTTHTEGARKTQKLYANASTGSVNTSGNIIIENAEAMRTFRVGTKAGGNVNLEYAASGNHGIISSGYETSLSDSSTYTASEKWIIYRASTGAVRIPEWASIGSASKPIYFDSNGRPVAGNTIGSGTVTSVAVEGSKGISVSGSPITSSGTITVSVSTSSGTATRNTTNTSAGEIKYTKYGRVVTVYTSTAFTITSTGAATSKVYFTGLPKPAANTCIIGYGPSNKAVAFGVNTDGQLVSMFQAPPSGTCEVGGTYIAAS